MTIEIKKDCTISADYENKCVDITIELMGVDITEIIDSYSENLYCKIVDEVMKKVIDNEEYEKQERKDV